MSNTDFNLPTSAQPIGKPTGPNTVMVEQPWFQFFLRMYQRVQGIGTFTTSAAVPAAGSNQGNAALLPSQQNRVTPVAPGSGVILPNSPVGGDPIFVSNGGANPLNIYPPVGGSINNNLTDAPITIAAGAGSLLFHVDVLQWCSR